LRVSTKMYKLIGDKAVVFENPGSTWIFTCVDPSPKPFFETRDNFNFSWKGCNWGSTQIMGPEIMDPEIYLLFKFCFRPKLVPRVRVG